MRSSARCTPGASARPHNRSSAGRSRTLMDATSNPRAATAAPTCAASNCVREARTGLALTVTMEDIMSTFLEMTGQGDVDAAIDQGVAATRVAPPVDVFAQQREVAADRVRQRG